MQTTSNILMIRPVAFGYNAETAVNNAFQQQTEQNGVQANALKEFDNFVEILRSHNINVTVVEDTQNPHTPDSIFPNNWISFHTNGTVVLYPMFAANRRLERRSDIIDQLKKQYSITNIVDFSHYESQDKFLEGTGSMVLDRDNHIAYACLSPRTDKKLLEEFCTAINYKPAYFHAVDNYKNPIYHTNVMMCVADKYIIFCYETIADYSEKEVLNRWFSNTNKTIIPITLKQVNAFAGNMLQVQNIHGEKFLVMSDSAYNSLTHEQIRIIEQFNPIIHAPIPTIETNGGGSVRCMMAEVHLPRL
ncbi:citrulline utilization hydrolase CtlX [Polluticaenibacter yanchengensis]|uniref:Arginine deiminase-related protein n=1 Tax=Polluticaenibacter yanchengensis TaxID=3014562 RepID=A0ABT4UJK0_9BACT|nr:arginine deiminase-related protein [Chitinophagaceae bacterium LY-5]